MERVMDMASELDKEKIAVAVVDNTAAVAGNRMDRVASVAVMIVASAVLVAISAAVMIVALTVASALVVAPPRLDEKF